MLIFLLRLDNEVIRAHEVGVDSSVSAPEPKARLYDI